MEKAMFVQFTGTAYSDALDHSGSAAGTIAQSGLLETLIGFESIGSRRSFARNEEIFAEGAPGDCWYKVVAGTVRLCKLLADGRRHIAEFYFSGDCFGLENMAERLFSAEAVSDVIVMRYPPLASRSWVAPIEREPAHASPIAARAARSRISTRCGLGISIAPLRFNTDITRHTVSIVRPR